MIEYNCNFIDWKFMNMLIESLSWQCISTITFVACWAQSGNTWAAKLEISGKILSQLVLLLFDLRTFSSAAMQWLTLLSKFVVMYFINNLVIALRFGKNIPHCQVLHWKWKLSFPSFIVNATLMVFHFITTHAVEWYMVVITHVFVSRTCT